MATSNSQNVRTGSNRVGRVLLLLIFVGLLSAVVWGSRQYIGDTGGDTGTMVLTHEVATGDLLVTVTEDGNVESASNLDIKCQVAGGSSILWIVPDGSTVKAGDKLVELDAAALEEQINQQRITYEKARSTKIQADKAYEVAKLAVREYMEGTFKKEKQDAEAQITIALENLRSAQNALEHAERMFRKGYVSSLELEGQKFAVERAQLELDSARTAMDVLVNFTKVKTLQDLESQRDTAEAQMKSETAAFQLEEMRLKRLEDQLSQCTIVAAQDGMVVYANERGGRFGQQQATIEEGAAVRERQTILRLPDLAQMQVKVNVHESKVDELELDMRAIIRILGRQMTGRVTAIANQPEPTGFFSANVKEYATTVRVDGQPGGLRPGMTAEVEILVAHLKDVVSLPVVAVVERRGQFYAWVQKPGGEAERRTLKLGQSNDKFIEVQDGVAEGEIVFLNPRTSVAEARSFTAEAASDQQQEDTSGRFGDGDGPAGNAGGRRPGGPGMSGPGASGSGPGANGTDASASSRSNAGRAPGSGPPDLMSFDQDGDGQISKSEAPEQMQRFFDNMDGNSDGFIDQQEVDALRARMGGAGRGPGGAAGPGTPPPSTPSAPSAGTRP